MTTPERGLFERIKAAIVDADNISEKFYVFFDKLEQVCTDFEQRLAEAERQARENAFRIIAELEIADQLKARVEGLEAENSDLRLLKERILNPQIQEGYQAVRRKLLFDAFMLVDPPPFEHDGKTMVFQNPHAIEVLTRLSAIVREMSTQQPLPTYEEAMALTAPAAKPEPYRFENGAEFVPTRTVHADFIDISKSTTEGLQEAINYAQKNNAELTIVLPSTQEQTTK
jgi:hypothetical protein